MINQIEKQSIIKGQTNFGLCVVCGLVAGVILFIDIKIPLGVAGGVPYIAVVLLSLKSLKKRITILAAVLCSILTIIGFFASPEGGEMLKVISNRALALFAIWVTATLALMQHTRDEELFEEKLKALKAKNELEITDERLKVLKATMRTVQDIVGNFLSNMQLFQLEVEENKSLPPETLEMMESIIHDTSKRLQTLGELDVVNEKEMPGGTIGVDYDES